jgi:hypothetical protein
MISLRRPTCTVAKVPSLISDQMVVLLSPDILRAPGTVTVIGRPTSVGVRPVEETVVRLGVRIARRSVRWTPTAKRAFGKSDLVASIAEVAGSIATACGDYSRWIGAIQARAASATTVKIRDELRIGKVSPVSRRMRPKT